MLLRIFLPMLLLLTACQPEVAPPNPAPHTVWAVDLVTTLPGQQDHYIESIKTNWANARHLAKERGAVRSYQAFAAPQDSLRGWDVLLMTEYADSTSWQNREPIFQSIFASDEFVYVTPGSPSAEMRHFFVSDVAMQHFVRQ